MSNYIQGDTVKLGARFYSWTGALQDLTGVAVKIYDAGGVQIGSTISGADITRESVGYYTHKYTLPLGYSTLIYEFSGTDTEGKVQLSRARLAPIFAI